MGPNPNLAGERHGLEQVERQLKLGIVAAPGKREDLQRELPRGNVGPRPVSSTALRARLSEPSFSKSTRRDRQETPITHDRPDSSKNPNQPSSHNAAAETEQRTPIGPRDRQIRALIADSKRDRGEKTATEPSPDLETPGDGDQSAGPETRGRREAESQVEKEIGKAAGHGPGQFSLPPWTAPGPISGSRIPPPPPPQSSWASMGSLSPLSPLINCPSYNFPRPIKRGHPGFHRVTGSLPI